MKKQCTKCQEVKFLTNFHNDKYSPRGKASWCKVCKSKKDKERRGNKDIYNKKKVDQFNKQQITEQENFEIGCKIRKIINLLYSHKYFTIGVETMLFFNPSPEVKKQQMLVYSFLEYCYFTSDSIAVAFNSTATTINRYYRNMPRDLDDSKFLEMFKFLQKHNIYCA